MLETQNASSVSVSLILILKGYAESMGVDFNSIAHASSFDLTVLEDKEARVPAKYFESMWRQIISTGNDPHPGLHFGLEMARHYPGGNILFTMMMNCATVGNALDTFIRYHRIMADAIQPELIKTGERIRLTWNILQTGFTPHPYMSEALLCTYHSILEHLSEGKLHPLEVCFTHPRPGDLSEYQKIFKAPLTFDAERNELLIGADSLDIRIQLANRELFKVLENYASRLAGTIGENKNWSSRVIGLLSDMLIKGIKPDIDELSKSLALSRRTLQEKLKDEETSFRNCLESVRKQIALDYLAKPDVTICDVTFLLGYSEQSAFNHAFKRWTGKSPRAYRLKTPTSST